MNTAKLSLIQQFPDVTWKANDKLMTYSRSSRRINRANPEPVLNEKDAEAKYYDKEFKKWHIKLALIIVTILAGLFMLIFSLPILIHLFQVDNLHN
jgi:hypothetical protein